MARSMTRPRARAISTALALAAVLSSMQVGATFAAGTPAVADTVAPDAPTNFHVVSRAKSGSITLGWVASYDAVGVAGYRMYRDGRWMGTLYQAGVDLIGTVWYDKLGGRTRTAVTYDLYAFDAAGNVSAPATLVVTP
jgi:hypothetical protein